MTPTIADRVAGLESDVRTLKATMTKVETHMVRANTYFDRAEGVLDADAERRKKNWKLIILVAPLVITAIIWLSSWTAGTVEKILKIEQNWQQAHPSEFVKPQQMFNDRETDQAQNQLAGPN
jgi:hypothetical protein